MSLRALALLIMRLKEELKVLPKLGGGCRHIDPDCAAPTLVCGQGFDSLGSVASNTVCVAIEMERRKATAENVLKLADQLHFPNVCSRLYLQA